VCHAGYTIGNHTISTQVHANANSHRRGHSRACGDLHSDVNNEADNLNAQTNPCGNTGA
jgi:hypothetical protein